LHRLADLNDWTIKNAYLLPLILLNNRYRGKASNHLQSLIFTMGIQQVRIKKGQRVNSIATRRDSCQAIILFFVMTNSPQLFKIDE